MQSKRVIIQLKDGQKHEISVSSIELIIGDSIIKGIDLKTKKEIDILGSHILDVNNKRSVFYNYKGENAFLTFEEAVHLASDNQIKTSIELLTEQESFIYILEHKIQFRTMCNHYARESLGEIKNYVEGKLGFKSFYARNLIDLCNYFEIAKHTIKSDLETLDWYQEQHLYSH